MQKLLIVSLLALAACARGPQRTSLEGDAKFNRLADDYLAGYLAWRPQAGTVLGLHQYDGKITDFSRTSIQSELDRLKQFDSHLSELGAAGFSPRAFYDYRILTGAIRREIFGVEKMQIYSRNPMTYAAALDVNIYIKRNFAPLEDRIRSITAILNQAPQIMAAARANLDGSLPRPLVETAIEQADGAADFLSKDLVNALRDVKNQDLMASFNAANHRAVDELRGYVTFLKEQRLPKADASYALGRDNYAKLLEYGEMLKVSPEKLLEIGLRELKREQQVFADTAGRIDPARTPIQVFSEIQKEHPTAPNLIPDTARDLDGIRQFVIDRRIITIPSPVRAHVTETPQYQRATSFASMDTPGPFEKKATEAYYYVTPVEPSWTPQQAEEWLTAFNYYDIAITSIHEAYPGHYVQFLCLNASPANRLEKIFTGYAFTEGWAHYCERMMVDEGFGKSGLASPSREEELKAAKYRLAQSDEALLRLCRLCVSIQMHCQGMTVDQATRFFHDNCYYEQKPARQEAIRGTFDPEYLYYTVGKLEILRLREDYRRQEGAGFSLQQFHDQLLCHGAPPIRLLRELMLKDAKLWDEVF